MISPERSGPASAPAKPPGEVHAVRGREQPAPESVVTIPGEPEQVAREIAHVGVEGKPAVAKEGPALVGREMIALAMIVFAGCALVGFLWSWEAAVVGLAFGALGLLVNPVMIAALMRRKDRVKLLERREGGRDHDQDPDDRSHEW